MVTGLTAVSLFTSGGIGDLAVRAAGFKLLVSSELLRDRHDVFSRNFPDVTAITGDVWRCSDRIVSATLARLGGQEFRTALRDTALPGDVQKWPGQVIELHSWRAQAPVGRRNRLIIPTMKIAKRLRPRILILENVPEMEQTLVLDEDGEPILILDFVARELGPDYVGRAEVVEFADYGVPQCRQRL